MPKNTYTMSDLFAQLGLPSDPQSIADFITLHAGACRECMLPYATMWTECQKTFLEEAIAEDADWCIPAERLASLLRE